MKSDYAYLGINPPRVYKDGVDFTHIHPAMLAADVLVRMTFLAKGYATVITAARDGQHMAGSKHYVGQALDYRTRHMQRSVVRDIEGELRLLLGGDFDLVVHSTHLHVEYDPK